MAEKTAKEQNTLAAFASTTHLSHWRYIVFGLKPSAVDLESGARGASRCLPHYASHELLHVLGFQHPRSDAAPGERPNARPMEQLQRDIAPGLSYGSGFGSHDATTGGRLITYCYNADPATVLHGQPEWDAQFRRDPSGTYVENMMNAADCADPQRSAIHKAIRTAMQDAFAHHTSLFNVRFVETTDAANANLLVFTGDIPARDAVSFEFTRGQSTAYDQAATIMSYTPAEPYIHTSSAPGDVFAAQRIYGQPVKREDAHLVSAGRLIRESGVLWSHQPLCIRLTESPLLGALKIDMGAPPLSPAVSGELRDEKGAIPVRGQLGVGATLRELDATGSAIGLDVTGTSGARITLGKEAGTVRLKGRGSVVKLGQGADSVNHLKGYGHEIHNLTEADHITTATDAKQVRAQHWQTPGTTGTHITFLREDASPTGSLFVPGQSPEAVLARLKELNLAAEPEKKPVTFAANDGDAFLSTTTANRIQFQDASDVAVSALNVSGRSVANVGAGRLIVKMNRPQYDSAQVSWEASGGYYKLTFRDGGKTHTAHFNTDTAIAIQSPDGSTEKLLSISEAKTETELSAALRRGSQSAPQLVQSLPMLAASQRQRS